MFKIKRVINGKEVEINLTEEEINEVRKQDNIQWARDILGNYSEMIVDYDSIINNEAKLADFAQILEQKNLENNGERELEVINKLFRVQEL